MMHRHDETSTCGIRHLNGLLGRAMRANPGVVSSNGHDRQIDWSVRAQFSKAIGKSGVASKKNAVAVSLQQITVVATVRVASPSRAPVFYRHGNDVDLTHRSLQGSLLVPIQFCGIAQTRPSK